MKFPLVSLAILVSLALPAQAGRESVSPEGPIFVPPLVNTPPSGGTPVDEDLVANNVVRQIADAQSFCAAVTEAEYRIDCLADQLAQVAQSIPPTGDFAEARQIVQQASRKLNAVAKKRVSKAKRPANLRSPVRRGTAAPKASSRPIVPVAREELPAANVEAEAVLTEATTLLLRASATSERRKIAYQQIAQAIDSSKILLRSS